MSQESKSPAQVIVEVKHSDELQEACSSSGFVGERSLDDKAPPSISAIEWDTTFAPIDVPARMPIGPPTNSLDVSERYVPNLDPKHATYLLRGSVADKARAAFEKEVTASESVVGVYADCEIQTCPICADDGPLEDDGTVEKLLCVTKLHSLGMDGSGVRIAVVDTGVNVAHLNGAGKTPIFDAARSWKPVSTTTGIEPGSMPCGHGTMVAFDCCIAAPKCTILDIALLQSKAQSGTIMSGFLSDAVLAYRYLIDDILKAPVPPGELRSLVVNNSWGMYHPSWDYPIGHPGNYSDNPNHPFNRIVGLLERAGADILFAAGNCGADCPDTRCAKVTANSIYGANSHPQVTCVAGVDVTRNRVGYSSIGPGRLAQRKPDLAGYTHFKGSGVYSADAGTSAATPVVAGVVAALRTKLPHDPSRPETSPAAVRDILIKSAKEAGGIGYDFEYGWGTVNGCWIAERFIT